MKLLARRFPLAVLVTCGAAFAALAAPAVAPAAEGQIIVQYEPGTDAGERAAARSDADVVADESLALRATELVTPDPRTSVSDAVADLEDAPGVAYAEPDQPRRAFDLYPDEARRANDQPFSWLWGLHNTGQLIDVNGTSGADIGAPAAWALTTGSPDVTVAVVDTGVDRTHPDLFANLVPGWDFAYGDSDPTDYDGHGTHVAGTIAARGNNGRGVVGVAWQTSLMPVQALDANGDGSVSDIVNAYAFAAARGARVVNASLGGGTYSAAEYQAIKAAKNVLFVVAAGNSGADTDVRGSYPCAYDLPNVLCVAATDNTDHLAAFSNYGARNVDIAAPGVHIYSTVGGPGRCGSYTWMSGTSMATPEVSGAAALVLAAHRDLTPVQVRKLLIDTADALPDAADRAKINAGAGGRLDVASALQSLDPAPTATGSAPATATGAAYAAPRVDEPVPPASSCPGAPAVAAAPLMEAPAQTPAPSAPAAPVAAPGAGVTPSQPAPPAAGAADTVAPALTLGASGRIALRAVLARGLRVRATCSERCTLRAELTVDARTAKRLKLSRRTVRVGTGTATGSPSAARSILVRFTARARRALRGAGSIRTTVRVTATDAAGNRRTSTRRLTLGR